MGKLLKSYFFWTYSRGSVHYDVMVTLILAFIFVTPWLWDYGAKPVVLAAGPSHPITITGDGNSGMIVTLAADDVKAEAGDTDSTVRHALVHAMQPVTGDSVFVEHWQTVQNDAGQTIEWKVWAHR